MLNEVSVGIAFVLCLILCAVSVACLAQAREERRKARYSDVRVVGKIGSEPVVIEQFEHIYGPCAGLGEGELIARVLWQARQYVEVSCCYDDKAGRTILKATLTVVPHDG